MPLGGGAGAASIEVSHLTVRYRGGNIALEDVSLTLNGSRICGLIGMNGSGKSTLFKAIMGFVPPTRGEVLVGGRDVRFAQRESAIAYVPQSEEVDWTFPVSVRDVVTMGRQGRMNLLRIASAQDRSVVADSLDRVGMSAFADRQIGELSGGQRKRVFLARALAQEARIVLLDEPFTGVDTKTEDAITAILRGLRSSGHLLLVSTHNLASVPALCDDVVLVNRRLVAAGPVESVYTPANIALAFGEMRQTPVPVPPGRGPDLPLDAMAGSQA